MNAPTHTYTWTRVDQHRGSLSAVPPTAATLAGVKAAAKGSFTKTRLKANNTDPRTPTTPPTKGLPAPLLADDAFAFQVFSKRRASPPRKERRQTFDDELTSASSVIFPAVESDSNSISICVVHPPDAQHGGGDNDRAPLVVSVCTLDTDGCGVDLDEMHVTWTVALSAKGKAHRLPDPRRRAAWSACAVRGPITEAAVLHGGILKANGHLAEDVWIMRLMPAARGRLVSRWQCVTSASAGGASQGPTNRGGRRVASKRRDHSLSCMAVDASVEALIVFGGVGADGSLLADLASLDLDMEALLNNSNTAPRTAAWKRVELLADLLDDGSDGHDPMAYSAAPCPRSHHSAAATPSGDYFVGGGVGAAGEALFDLWCINLRRGTLLPPRWRPVQLSTVPKSVLGLSPMLVPLPALTSAAASKGAVVENISIVSDATSPSTGGGVDFSQHGVLCIGGLDTESRRTANDAVVWIGKYQGGSGSSEWLATAFSVQCTSGEGLVAGPRGFPGVRCVVHRGTSHGPLLTWIGGSPVASIEPQPTDDMWCLAL